MKNLENHERETIILSDGRELDYSMYRYNAFRRRFQATNPNRTVKTEWCERWIIKSFERLPNFATGIECNLFLREAEEAGLYREDGDNDAFTDAVVKLLDIDYNGHYHTFSMIQHLRRPA